MNKKQIRKMQTAAGGPLFPWQQNIEWVNDWKFRTTPAGKSKVLSGKGVETDKQYTERRKKETTKRTWRSDAADIAHGVGEGVLALHPYTAIPYYGAKVGQDALNGNVSWQTALNASVPLFHLAPQAVGLREATNVALEDAANAGSKTAKAIKGKKASNETAYSKEVKSPFYKYNENGEPVAFDAENVYSQIKAGKQDFINETLSPEYAEAAIRNMEEAQAMGLSYTPVFEKPGFQSLVQNGITPKFVQDPKGGWHASTSFFGGTPGRPSEVTYNVSKPSNIRTATAHESGHVSRWGMGESPAEHQYMKHKASQIFKDEGDVGVYEFGSQTGEGATNMRDLGKDIGVTQRTPYPGYEEALKKLKEAETTSTKGGIVKALRLDREHMPYIWRALQGLHYGIAPTLIGGYTLYNLLNNQNNQKLEYRKQGGKMNILEFLKNGSGIHIKEKNKGKFTSYCGGKVTSECIAKGKNSPNPAIRKRATFAANARKWKHKEGGKIDFLSLGGWFKNTFNNVSSFLGSDMGKSVLSIGSGLIGLGNGISNSGKIADAANANLNGIDAIMSANKQKAFFEHEGKEKQEDSIQNPDVYVDGSIIHNQGGVTDSNRIYTKAINSFNFDTSKYDQAKQQIMEQAQVAQDQNTAQMAGSIFDQIQGLSTSIFGNKNKAAVKGTATGSTIGTTGTTTYVGTNGSLRLNNMLA